MSEARRLTWSWLPLWLVSAPLAAQTEESVRFEYAAPEGCPTVEAFAAEVRERTSRGRWVGADQLARVIVVRIASEEGGFVGAVELSDDAGAPVGRSVRGEQCEAVVSSLALITALALDAALSQEPPADPRSVPPPPAATPPSSSPPAVAPEEERRAARVPSAPSPVVSGARLGLVAGYGGAEHAPRLGLLGQLDLFGTASLRFVVHYGWDDAVGDALGRQAQLRLLGLETSVCPWRFAAGQVTLAPCAALDVGSLRLAGRQDERLTSAGADTILWAALGAELRLGWEPRAPLWLEARAQALSPLRQGYRFTFENPRETVYEVPPLALSVGLAGGVRF